MAGILEPLPTGKQIKGIAVCWGMGPAPKFTGHMKQSASLQDGYDVQEKVTDDNGITQTYIFNDGTRSLDVELVVKEGVPTPAPSTIITEIDTGQKWLVMTRGSEYTNRGATRVRLQLERGEGALFAP